MIKIKDLFTIAINNLKHRKKRTFLTILGIIIGISAVVALISIGQGMSYSINKEMEKIGTDKIFIQPKSATGMTMSAEGGAGTIGKKDLNLVKKVTGVKEAVGIYSHMAQIEFGKELQTVYSFGYPKKQSEASLMDEVHTWKVAQGRMLKPGEKGKAVIGTDIAETLFEQDIQVGNKIKIEDQVFKVIGVFKKVGDPGLDKGILISEHEIREIYDEPELFTYLYVQIGPNENLEITGDRIERKMRKDRGLKEGQEDFSVQTPLEMMEMFNNVLAIVSIVLIGIAAISLLVGGIGIMNTMYTSVLQRTHEIGIMKAIGAKNSGIMKLFLVESGILGLVGGALGVLIGFLISKSVEIAAAQAIGTDMLKAFFPWYLIVGALLFSFLIGTLSGILPAKRASHLKPVDALRYAFTDFNPWHRTSFLFGGNLR